MIIRWPGKVPAGKTENGLISGLDWFPTLVAAAGYQGDIAADLRKGKQLGDGTYKVHLDGYNQMDLITGKGKSNRHEIFYFAESTISARCASTTLNIGLSTSRAAGWAVRSRLTGRSSPIFVSILLSGRGYLARYSTRTGGPTSSGALSS